jgi:hypothetical protein
VATNIRTAGTAPFNSRDHFTGAAYGLALTLTDEACDASGTVTFTGVFNGTLTALSTNITNSFPAGREHLHDHDGFLHPAAAAGGLQRRRHQRPGGC